MANKTIGQLTKATQMTDDTLIPVEQDGMARSMSGALIRKMCENAVDEEAIVNAVLANFTDVSEVGL